MIGIVLSENVFIYFYFLIVHISLYINVICMKLLVLMEDIAIEETKSQISYIGPHSYFMKCRKKIFKKITKKLRFVYIK